MKTQLSFDVRAEFPVKERYAFMNHAGVAPLPASCQAAISEFARDAAEEGPVNYPAWLHAMSMTRQNAGTLLNCEPDDICFTKNTNHGLMIAANSINWKAGDNVVGLEHEFPANIIPWKNLARLGVELRLVPERADYTYSVEEIAARMDDRTRLLAVSWVEYSTGVRNDIAALSALCRERNVLFCLDAIQGLGALPLDLQEIHVDFLSADGHKWMLAPEGCGVLYVRRELIPELNTSMAGWCGLRNPQDYDNTEQPYKPNARRFEEGSHNLMSIRAFGTSLQVLLDAGIQNVEERIRSLTTQIIEGVRRKGYAVVTPEPWELRAGIVSFHKPGVDPTPIFQELMREHKIVIAARRGWLRASPHFYNDEEEIDRLVTALP
ncbi:MAG: aminotransferase class V-fold PLP-dependent enzyme [Candidatus Sumerlaeaceae bacterium]